mmetsp:Transcript_26398/g.46261  ORF Transcript_26398/g.46261 Transcript_26398/m.46261 type:complete len:160 (-) Transcript_26398:5-484(-)
MERTKRKKSRHAKGDIGKDPTTISADLFEAMFDGIRTSFSANSSDVLLGPTSNVVRSVLPSVCAEEAWLASYSKNSTPLQRTLTMMATSRGERSVAEIQRQRAFHKQRRLARMSALRLRRQQVESQVASCKASAELRDTLYRRRLEQQKESAQRRLQEV